MTEIPKVPLHNIHPPTSEQKKKGEGVPTQEDIKLPETSKQEKPDKEKNEEIRKKVQEAARPELPVKTIAEMLKSVRKHP